MTLPAISIDSHNADIPIGIHFAPMATIDIFLTSSSKARRAVEALPVWAGAKAAAEPRMAARQAAVFMVAREEIQSSVELWERAELSDAPWRSRGDVQHQAWRAL